MAIKINNAGLVFKSVQRARSTTNRGILHHSGVTVLQSVQTVHNYYLNRQDADGDTYIGIGYHLYVRKDGTVWKGREMWAIGGHAGAANSDSVGVCFEGNFEIEQMGAVQLAAGREVIAYLRSLYPEIKFQKHKEVSATDCPGRNFPFDALISQTAAAPVTASVPFPGAQFFGPGKKNKYILMLDKALIAKGFAKYYKAGANGASQSWGTGTQKACMAFQEAQGWTGADADGIPGAETWKRLGISK